jgi:hypothetical protein
MVHQGLAVVHEQPLVGTAHAPTFAACQNQACDAVDWREGFSHRSPT